MTRQLICAECKTPWVEYSIPGVEGPCYAQRCEVCWRAMEEKAKPSVTDEIKAATTRVLGVAIHGGRGLTEWYPVHAGDDAPATTRDRQYRADLRVLCDYVLKCEAGSTASAVNSHATLLAALRMVRDEWHKHMSLAMDVTPVEGPGEFGFTCRQIQQMDEALEMAGG